MASRVVNKAQGCLLGQLAGDSLGSLVEFQSPEEIRSAHPEGVRDLVDGGVWDTLAGQPTDDSEMALLLARSIVDAGGYDRDAAREMYDAWIESGPFDCGMTIEAGLRGRPNHKSQANGALMRACPIGILGGLFPLEEVDRWARLDAAITHPNEVCLQANALFCMAIATAVATEISASQLHERIHHWSIEMDADISVREVIERSCNKPPADYLTLQGWVLIALGNALYRLLHEDSLEEAVIGTVMRGGDTDTNAAICGALLGAVHGLDAVPDRWREAILNCRPEQGREGVQRPRPRLMWPVGAMELAEKLVEMGSPAAQ
ncbi:MAG: ADP-ribosylglycohydrolase family protein [Phycisphaerales bacterium]